MNIRHRPVARRLHYRNFALSDGQEPPRSVHILVDLDPETNNANPNLVMNHADVRAWGENGEERNRNGMTWKEWVVFAILVLLNMYLGYKLIMSSHHAERRRARSGGAAIPQFVVPDGNPPERMDRDTL